MKAKKLFKIGLLASISFFLFGCGVAHVKTEVQSSNMETYKNVIIENVKVYSNETAAKKNIALQEKLKKWELYSRTQLENHINSSKYTLLKSVSEDAEETLLLDLDVNVRYGNQALRWVIGFGAGKGGVDSVLTLKDAKNDEIKYKAHADSDLSMGPAGGSIESVLKENINELIKQYNGV